MSGKNIFLLLCALCVLCAGCQNSGTSSGGSVSSGWSSPFASKETKRAAAEKEAQELIAEAEKSMQTKMYADARGGYMKVLAFYETHPEVKRSEHPYCRLGYACEELKLFDQAEDYYQQALAINDQSADVYNSLGVCLLTQQKYGEAIRYIEKAVELSPAEAKYHNNLGLAYGAAENYAKAYEHFCMAVPPADACYNMYGVFAHQGKEEEAIRALQRALTLNPGHKEASRMLATYDEQNKYPEFNHSLQDFRQTQPGGMMDYRENFPALATDMTQASVSAQYGTGYRQPAGGTYHSQVNQPMNQPTNGGYQQPASQTSAVSTVVYPQPGQQPAGYGY